VTLTTSVGIWLGAGATKGLTSPAAHRGIWHSAGATKSSFHSPTLKKSFVVVKKVSIQPKLFIQLIREMLRDDIRIGIGDIKNINPDA
jgi:hypothetical protein